MRGTANAFKDVCCNAKGDINCNVFCVRAICTEVPLTTRPSGCQVPNYLINIVPPIIFNNQLPFVIDVVVPGINYEVKIEPGEKINMHSLNHSSNVQFIFKVCRILKKKSAVCKYSKYCSVLFNYIFPLNDFIYRYTTTWVRLGWAR